MPGCALFGKNKLEQCQSESERLLADYRLERDRANQLAEQNQQITARVAELEQRLATLDGPQGQRVAARAEEEVVERDVRAAEETLGLERGVRGANDDLGDHAEPLKPLPDPWRKAAR
ncbi:hypothetical protein [Roseimaritima ulvae]|nr:hypothetical protein [Roseimaritima ulvae]